MVLPRENRLLGQESAWVIAEKSGKHRTGTVLCFDSGSAGQLQIRHRTITQSNVSPPFEEPFLKLTRAHA